MVHFEILAEFTITYNFIPRERSYVHEIKQLVDETKYLGVFMRIMRTWTRTYVEIKIGNAARMITTLG